MRKVDMTPLHVPAAAVFGLHHRHRFMSTYIRLQQAQLHL